ncbi:related to Thymidylate kinase [Saccharomycodes ludwigii]|uniref:dTMP kinase n=1 Tax=Saccharomycodes ludwigii TaxID=36035 RepID=A0A376B211_9ASCO|nr:hypothetical protein SCDLUD_000431 [Saccharomycodes ludwigii]KAH3902839.1 hypothetical protein SCDLUD_000431 [Saccharomycodes ludwigii]SSD58725.1 related to Thymidylate kinase [Saccharomycodes ludwigii]
MVSQNNNNNNSKRGYLILIEGLDRTGKSTQAQYLSEISLLNDPILYKFPNRSTNIGKIINRYLTDKTMETVPDQTIHLLFSSNRWECINEIKTCLLNGKNVILDRYVYSGIAYSMAKNIKQMDYKWCYNCDVGLLKPDLTLFFQNRKNAMNTGFGDERYETADFQQQVATKFNEIFYKWEDKKYLNENIKFIDVENLSIRQVNKIVLQTVQEFIDAEKERQEKQKTALPFKFFEPLS